MDLNQSSLRYLRSPIFYQSHAIFCILSSNLISLLLLSQEPQGYQLHISNTFAHQVPATLVREPSSLQLLKLLPPSHCMPKY